MDDNEETTFENKCGILAEIWMECRDDVNYVDIFNYGDLAFPLAYLIDNKYVEVTEEGKGFVDEIFELLLDSLGIEQDTGFEDMDDLFTSTDGEGLAYFGDWEVGEYEDEDEDEEDEEDSAK
jgi:hypothetical protein